MGIHCFGGKFYLRKNTVFKIIWDLHTLPVTSPCPISQPTDYVSVKVDSRGQSALLSRKQTVYG